MIVLVETSEVVGKFLDRGMHVTPDALDRISNSSESVISQILSELEGREDRPSIVTDRIVSQILESEETIPSAVSTPSTDREGDAESELAEGETFSQVEADASEEVVLEGKEGDANLRNFRDITGNSSSEGKVEDFVQLFRDRYEKLSSIVLSREGFQNYTEMRNIVRHEGDMVNLVGLVNEKRETRKKDAWIVELEDPTGKAVAFRHSRHSYSYSPYIPPFLHSFLSLLSNLSS
ncbi:hypothetical protein AKJ66_04595, partial [candidate division MSBL1 archaeon SCGC-AAA259E22]